MKVKVSKLIGPALDWTVAKCEGHPKQCFPYTPNGDFTRFRPSTNWAQGGPIIEREGLYIAPYAGGWLSSDSVICESTDGFGPSVLPGNTPLIATMRCYVASRLGDEVEIPDELCG